MGTELFRRYSTGALPHSSLQFVINWNYLHGVRSGLQVMTWAVFASR